MKFRTNKLIRRIGGLGVFYLSVDYMRPQRGADMRGIAKGLTNAFIAFPLVGICWYDYMRGLRGLEYGTDEYIKK